MKLWLEMIYNGSNQKRAKFGINDNQLRPCTISKEIGKLFPWLRICQERITQDRKDCKDL